MAIQDLENASNGGEARKLGGLCIKSVFDGARSARLSKWSQGIPLGIMVGLAIWTAGCGGGGSSPPPSSSSITVTISPTTASVPVGGTQQFTATVTGTSNTTVTWSVNDVVGGNSTVGTITTSGFYVAPNTVPSPNTVTVRATSQADSAKSASATVTITVPPLVLNSLAPIVATQNSESFTLTTNGSGFTADSQVLFNGTPKTTTFVGPAQLKAEILSGDLSQPGTFALAVRRGTTTSSPLDFFVVPAIKPQVVTVASGGETKGVNIAVPAFSAPSLLLLAVGVGTSATSTGTEIKQGQSASLFLGGQGISPGTFYMISGRPNDVTVTQPLASDFVTARDSKGNETPAVKVRIQISPSAALGPRNILVTNPAGEISVFVGGLLITPGS